MDKRRLHHIWKKLRPIKPRYFFALFVVVAIVSVVALRHNNQTMIKLRDDVFAADQADGDVNGALKTLQGYVTSHMNTSLTSASNAVYPPIQLKYTYERLQDAQLQQVQANNSQLYTAAEDYCQQQDPTDFSGRNRVPCVEQYVQSHGVAVTPIPTGLYEFDFVSPSWSPDLAGWSLVASVGLFVLGSGMFLVHHRLKKLVS